MLDHQRQISKLDGEFLTDVLDGLNQSPKRLSCKYYYDDRGSKLFEQICDVEEYYLTNCELEIMKAHAGEMVECLGSAAMLVEFGSGSSLKTTYLLDALTDSHTQESFAYVPVDVSSIHLQESVAKLRSDYPNLQIEPIVADFTQPIEFPSSLNLDVPRTVYFPGSTVGNFTPEQTSKLLEIIVNEIGHEGGLLLGVDLQKDPQIIEAAYNDDQGITAEFNLNLLHRINRELRGDFEVEQFEHRSIYNESLGRIETSIVSLQDQQVNVADECFEFSAGEQIHTEYSYKYTIEEFAEFAKEFGLSLDRSWVDSQGYFAVLHLTLQP